VCDLSYSRVCGDGGFVVFVSLRVTADTLGT
jgi:hypothetical protein